MLQTNTRFRPHRSRGTIIKVAVAIVSSDERAICRSQYNSTARFCHLHDDTVGCQRTPLSLSNDFVISCRDFPTIDSGGGKFVPLTGPRHPCRLH